MPHEGAPLLTEDLNHADRLLTPYLSLSHPSLGKNGGGVTTASWLREQSPLSLFPPAKPSATILKLPQGGHGSPLPAVLPWQPCSSHQTTRSPLFTGDPVIKRFLSWDKNLTISDKVKYIPAPPSVLGTESFLSPQLSLQPDALSALLLRDRGVSYSVDGEPCH